MAPGRLGQPVAAVAATSPTAFGVPGGNIDLALGPTPIAAILAAAKPDLGPRLSAGGASTAVSEAQWNAAFDAWGEETPGEHAPICVRGGLLVENLPGRAIDFAVGANTERVVSGFGATESTGFRWMTGAGRLVMPAWTGALLIRASTPVTALRRTRPGLPGIALRVLIDGGAAGGFLVQTADAPAVYRVMPQSPPTGAIMTLDLVADRTWRPAELLPENLDPRVMSIALFSIGAEGERPGAVPCSAPPIDRASSGE